VDVILVGGGARSGKSSYALELARQRGGRLGFVATAEAFDDEMRDRIAAHQRDRSPEFDTLEAPYELPAAIRSSTHDTLVVDCLTLWASNLMLAGRDLADATADAIDAARAHPGTVLFVTNEVGLGIVPENALARRFRDEAGRMNQRIAAAANEVYWMVFGIPLRLKPAERRAE
jgi:adenosylcobinamide kinase/adenosylcobinamide-phosphate guanylyltransferase